MIEDLNLSDDVKQAIAEMKETVTRLVAKKNQKAVMDACSIALGAMFVSKIVNIPDDIVGSDGCIIINKKNKEWGCHVRGLSDIESFGIISLYREKFLNELLTCVKKESEG